MSFIRLVGTFYFKKHLTAFITRKGHETPLHLYNSIDSSLLPEEKHEAWLQEIRKIVCDRILNEEDRVPSFTSLWRHWMRSCWVSQMWQNSSEEDSYNSLSLPEDNGWIQIDETYAIDWEATEVQAKVKDKIDFLTKAAIKAVKQLIVDAEKNLAIVGQDVCAMNVPTSKCNQVMTKMTQLLAVTVMMKYKG